MLKSLYIFDYSDDSFGQLFFSLLMMMNKIKVKKVTIIVGWMGQLTGLSVALDQSIDDIVFESLAMHCGIGRGIRMTETFKRRIDIS